MSDSSASTMRMVIAGTAVFGLGLAGGYLIARRDKSERRPTATARIGQPTESGNANNNAAGEVIRAPFPPALVQLLQSTSLCYLSTTGKNAAQDSAGDPHLSLMLFTFQSDPKEGDVIVMTTRRDTQKLQNILLNPKVAILVHDFPAAKGEFEYADSHTSSQKNASGASEKYSRTSSITVYGHIRILDEGSVNEARYRENHMRANPKYGQFIEGPGIAVLLVIVESARICNVDDKVTMWSVHGDDSPKGFKK